jgi:hypothetical protein
VLTLDYKAYSVSGKAFRHACVTTAIRLYDAEAIPSCKSRRLVRNTGTGQLGKQCNPDRPRSPWSGVTSWAMMSDKVVTSSGLSAEWQRRLSSSALGLAAIVLSLHAAYLVLLIVRAVRFPFELDYGEGIVWQQMWLIMAGQAYGRIAGFPAIAFHYPPIFHLLTAVLHGVTGLDELVAGRLVSVTATALICMLTGTIIFGSLRREIGSRAAILCAVIGGLVILSFWPVQKVSVLMRVDMVAVAFSFAGVFFALCARSQPRLIYLAALCFVAAIFTKQNAIAAPAATFLTLLIVSPKTALAGIATTLLVGLAILTTLAWITDGNFLRHIFLYNINRLAPSNINLFENLAAYAGYFYVVVRGALCRLQDCQPFPERGHRISALRDRLSASPYDAALFLFLVYFGLATPMLLMILKSGAWIGYFVEYMCVVGVLTGLFMRDAAILGFGKPSSQTGTNVGNRMIALNLAAAVAIQAVILLIVPHASGAAYLAKMSRPERMAELQDLVRMIRNANRPVISDDMILILRSGKQVQLEPAIFAELASAGLWDQQPVVNLIRSHAFAFFVTEGDEGEELYDKRYTPAVTEAIKTAYPNKRHLADYTLHFEVPTPPK